MQENINPIGSKMMWRVSGVDIEGNIVHSIKVVEFVHTEYIIMGVIIDRRIHIIMFADL